MAIISSSLRMNAFVSHKLCKENFVINRERGLLDERNTNIYEGQAE